MHWQFQQDSRWWPALPNAFTFSFLLTPGRSTHYTFIHILTLHPLQSEGLQHLAHEFIFIGRTENTHTFSGAREPCRPWWGITADRSSPPPSHRFSLDASEQCTEAPSVQTPLNLCSFQHNKLFKLGKLRTFLKSAAWHRLWSFGYNSIQPLKYKW